MHISDKKSLKYIILSHKEIPNSFDNARDKNNQNNGKQQNLTSVNSVGNIESRCTFCILRDVRN